MRNNCVDYVYKSLKDTHWILNINRHKGEKLGGSPRTQLKNVILKYGDQCYICKLKKQKYDVEHEVPICISGNNTIENTRPCCRACHHEKDATDKRVIAILKMIGALRGSGWQYEIYYEPAEMERLYHELKQKVIFCRNQERKSWGYDGNN